MYLDFFHMSGFFFFLYYPNLSKNIMLSPGSPSHNQLRRSDLHSVNLKQKSRLHLKRTIKKVYSVTYTPPGNSLGSYFFLINLILESSSILFNLKAQEVPCKSSSSRCRTCKERHFQCTHPCKP